MNTTKLKAHLSNRYGRMIGVFHNGLAGLGLLALVFMAVQGVRMLPSANAEESAAFGAIHYENVSLFEPSADGDNPRFRVISTYLSRRYRVSSDAIEQLVSAAHTAGRQVGLDPLLILSVMAIESRFNPIAESDMGAKGLMQVMPQHHRDKFSDLGGVDTVLDPMTNILIGARILKDCIRRGGGLEGGGEGGGDRGGGEGGVGGGERSMQLHGWSGEQSTHTRCVSLYSRFNCNNLTSMQPSHRRPRAPDAGGEDHEIVVARGHLRLGDHDGHRGAGVADQADVRCAPSADHLAVVTRRVVLRCTAEEQADTT